MLSLPGFNVNCSQAVGQCATRRHTPIDPYDGLFGGDSEDDSEGDEELDRELEDGLKEIGPLPPNSIVAAPPASSPPKNNGNPSSAFTPIKTEVPEAVIQHSVAATPIPTFTTSPKANAPRKKQGGLIVDSTPEKQPNPVSVPPAQDVVRPAPRAPSTSKNKTLGKRKASSEANVPPTQATFAIVQVCCFALENKIPIPACGDWAAWKALFGRASWKLYQTLRAKSYTRGIGMNDDCDFACIRRSVLNFDQKLVDDCLEKAREALVKERKKPKPKVASTLTVLAPAVVSESQVTSSGAPAPSASVPLCAPPFSGEGAYTSLSHEAEISAPQRSIRPLPNRPRSQGFIADPLVYEQQGHLSETFPGNQPISQHVAYPTSAQHHHHHQSANVTTPTPTIATGDGTLFSARYTPPTPYRSNGGAFQTQSAYVPPAGPSVSPLNNGLQSTSDSHAYGNHHNTSIPTSATGSPTAEQSTTAPTTAATPPTSGAPPGTTQKGTKEISQEMKVKCRWKMSDGHECGAELSPKDDPRAHCMRAHQPEKIAEGEDKGKYKCGWDGCPSVFNTDGLKKHLNKKNHFGFDVVLCEYCERPAARGSTLRRDHAHCHPGMEKSKKRLRLV